MSAITNQQGQPVINVSSTTRVLAVVVAILFLLLILDLVRRRKLQERYTVVWFLAGLALLALALVPGLLGWLADRAGVKDTNSLLFAMTLVVAGLLLLNLTSASQSDIFFLCRFGTVSFGTTMLWSVTLQHRQGK